MKKKLLASLLALVMVLSLLPATALAAGNGEEDTASVSSGVKIESAGYAKNQETANAQVNAASGKTKTDVAASTFWLKTSDALPHNGDSNSSDVGGYIFLIAEGTHNDWNACLTASPTAAYAATNKYENNAPYSPTNEGGDNFFYFSTETEQWFDLTGGSFGTTGIKEGTYTLFLLYFKHSEAPSAPNGIFNNPNKWYEIDSYILNLVEDESGNIAAASSASGEVKDGKVEITDKEIESVIGTAIAGITDDGSVDQTPVATITATGDNLEKAAVEVSSTALGTAADNNVSVALEVNGLGTITLDPTAISKALESVSGGDAKLTLEVAKAEGISGDVNYPDEFLGEGALVFTASVLVADEDGEGTDVVWPENSNAKITLTFNLGNDDGLSSKTAAEINVYQDGEKLDRSCIKSLEHGILTLEVSHLSEFAVVEMTAADKADELKAAVEAFQAEYNENNGEVHADTIINMVVKMLDIGGQKVVDGKATSTWELKTGVTDDSSKSLENALKAALDACKVTTLKVLPHSDGETKIADLGFLLPFYSLEELDISGNTGLANLGALLLSGDGNGTNDVARMSDLKTLNVSGCTSLTKGDLNFLSKLETLNLSNTGFTDSDAWIFAKIATLKNLDISENGSFAAAWSLTQTSKQEGDNWVAGDPPAYLGTLASLNISKTGITDMGTINKTKLTVLNEVKATDLANLANIGDLSGVTTADFTNSVLTATEANQETLAGLVGKLPSGNGLKFVAADHTELRTPVASVALNKTTLSLTVGGTETLTATVTPENATEKSVTWTSNNATVATVDENGKVTAIAQGTATITATADGRSADCTVTVTKRSSGGGGGSSGGGGGGGSSANVTTPSATGGKVSVDKPNAKKGDTVTITATPNTGKVVDTVTVSDAKGNKINVTDAGDGKYTFTMPDVKVTVKVTFKDKPADVTSAFTDVPANAYYADAVAWAVEKGVTTGTSAITFSPDAPCTRAQIVTFLWRAAGSPKATGSNPFTDVKVDAYYSDAVLWAVEQGITSGTSATTFSPDTTCTRAQAVTFLYRYAKSPAVSGTNSFADVDTNTYYANAVQWAVNKNVTAGTSATTFSPNATCTRAQIVTFLYRDLAE